MHFEIDESTTVAKLFRLNCFQLHNQKMTTNLSEDFFNKHNCRYSAFIEGQFVTVSDKSNVGYDRKNNAIFFGEDTLQIRKRFEISPMNLSSILNKIANAIEQNSDLFAQIEYDVRGVNQNDTLNFDIPQITASFRYYASRCDVQKYLDGFQPVEVVYRMKFHDISPLAFLGWIVAPALSTKCIVEIQSTVNVTAIAVLFAELCFKAGLPVQALHILPTGIDNKISKHVSSKRLKNLSSPEHFGGTMIICESADLDSVIDSIFKAAWSHNGMLSWSLKRMIVQESIQKIFKSKLAAKLKRQKRESPFLSGNIDDETSQALQSFVYSLKQRGVEYFDMDISNGESEQSLPRPVILTDNLPLADEEFIFNRHVPLPVVLTQAFRTTKEVINMVNSRPAFAVSVWCDRVTVANEICKGVHTKYVWLNSYGLFSGSTHFDWPQFMEDKYMKKEEAFEKEKNKLDNPRSHIESIAKLQSVWAAKLPEERAYAYKSMAEMLLNNSQLYIKKQVDMCELSESKAKFILEKSIEFLERTALECLKPSGSCTFINQTMRSQVKEPLGVISVCPESDLMHEFIISIASVTRLRNGAIYDTRSSLIEELAKSFSKMGVPVVALRNVRYFSVRFNEIKYVWLLPDLLCKDKTVDEKDDVLRLFNMASCSEIMEHTFSNVKTIWSTVGETYSN